MKIINFTLLTFLVSIFSLPSVNADALITASRFKFDNTVKNKFSYWNKMASFSKPTYSRNTTIYGNYPSSCSVNHGPNVFLGGYNYPVCSSTQTTNRGPSYEGDNSTGQHRMHNEIPKNGTANIFISNFDSSGQNGQGNNAYILPIYTVFSMPIATAVMKPWGLPGSDMNKVRAAFISTLSVPSVNMPDPNNQQFQQTLRFVVTNKYCKTMTPTYSCQIELNFKAFMKGVYVNSNLKSSDAQVMVDPVQGGMIAALIPFNEKSKSTRYKGASIATSWGSPSALNAYSTPARFQNEISWNQFVALLKGATSNAPQNRYGQKWNVPSEWYLTQAGYGTENFNRSYFNFKSAMDATFSGVDVIGLN